MVDVAGNFSGRPYRLQLSVQEAGQSGNSSYFNWQLYAISNSGYGSYGLDQYGWSVNVAGQGFSGAHSLDFRPDSTGKTITIATGSTGWIGHDGNGNLSISFSASMGPASVFGTASCSGSMAAGRIAQPPKPPSISSVTVITDTSARVTFALGDNMGATIDSGQAQWATDSGFTSIAWTDNGIGGGTISQPSGAGVSLTAGTQYWVRVRSHNSAGWGAWSSAVTLQTLTAPAAPVGSASGGQMTVAWSRPAANRVSNPTGFDIQYSTDATFAAAVSTITVGLGASPYTVAGLTQGVTEHVRVRERYSDTVGPWSAATVVMLGGGMYITDGSTFSPAVGVFASDGTTLTPAEVEFSDGSTWAAAL